MELNLSNTNWCKNEIDSLRAQLAKVSAQRNASNRKIEELTDQLAEVTRERDGIKHLMDCYNLGGWTDSIGVSQQLLVTQAHVARLKDALIEYARKEECEGLYESISHKALSTPINLDALHEALALECERLANVAGDEPEHVKALFSEWLREEADTHRSRCSTANTVAKKEGK